MISMVESISLRLSEIDCQKENIPKILHVIKSVIPNFSVIEPNKELNKHSCNIIDFTIIYQIIDQLHLTIEKEKICDLEYCQCFSTDFEHMVYSCRNFDFYHGELVKGLDYKSFMITRNFWGDTGYYTERESIFYVLFKLIQQKLQTELQIKSKLNISNSSLTQTEIRNLKQIVKKLMM